MPMNYGKKLGLGAVASGVWSSSPHRAEECTQKAPHCAEVWEAGWVQDKRAGGRNAQFLPSVFSVLCLKLHVLLSISVAARLEMPSPRKETLGISPPGSAQVTKEQF